MDRIATHPRLLLGIFLLLGLLMIPGTVSAHPLTTQLLRSEPTSAALLSAAPSQVRLWFNTALQPGQSVVAVVDAHQKRVDRGISLVSPSNPDELTARLQTPLPPGNYFVVWRVFSATNGQILSGTYSFSVTEPNGVVPASTAAPHLTFQGERLLINGAATSPLLPSLLAAIMVCVLLATLFFWFGAQCWHLWLTFASGQPDGYADTQTKALNRFEQHFSFPTLTLFLLASAGTLVAQSLQIQGQNWAQALSLTNIIALLGGSYGLLWLARIIIAVLAIMHSLVMTSLKSPSTRLLHISTWINFVLGLALLATVILTGPAAANEANIRTYALIAEGATLLGAALWIGGLLYLVGVFLPQLRGATEQVSLLLATLRRFALFELYGFLLLILGTVFRLLLEGVGPWSSLYGLSQIIGGVSLLVLLALTLFLTRILIPRVTQLRQSESKTAQETSKRQEPEESQFTGKLNFFYRKLLRGLHWQPLPAIVILVCMGFMFVFAEPVQTTAQQQTSQTVSNRPFSATLETTDRIVTVQLAIAPNRSGPNTFTVRLTDRSGKPITNAQVSLRTTMPDMVMVTSPIEFQHVASGEYKAEDVLAMSGRWQFQVLIRLPDSSLHEARVEEVVP